MTLSSGILRTIGAAAIAAMALMAVLTAQGSSASAGQGDKQFQAALQLEMVTGDLRRAIEEYRKIVARPGISRALAADALLRIAECQQKAGDAEAQKTYQEIVTKYSDQTAAATARTRLDATRGSTTIFKSRDILKLIEWGPSVVPQSPLGRVSPDGRWLVFTRVDATQSVQPADAPLCIRDLRNGDEKILIPSVGGDRPLPYAQWSPDSRRIAVSRVVTDATIVRREINLIDLANAAAQPVRLPSVAVARQAATPRFPEPMMWSADSRLIAFVAATGAGAHEVRVFDVSTGRTRPLAPFQPNFEAIRSLSLPQLRWSPDNAEVVVQNGGVSGSADVQILSVANGSARVVPLRAETGQRMVVTAWTPRGLVLRQEPQATRASNVPVPLQILMLDVASGRSSVVCEGALSDNNAGNPAEETLQTTDTDICLGVTSDGQHAMRWSTEHQRVLLRNTATGKDTPLTTGIGEERFATFIHNDRTVLFLSNRDGRWRIYAAPVARVPVSTPALVATLDRLPSSVAIKPTSDGFVWNANYGGWYLWKIDTDPVTMRASGDPVRLTPEEGDSILAAISPDGKRVAYWSRRGYKTGLAVMDASGANKRIVRETDQQRFHNYGASPAWVSNDEILYADYWRRTSERKFFVFNLRTGENTSIPFPELESAPADGTRRSWQYVPALRQMVYLDRKDQTALAVFRARPLSGGPDRIVASLDVPLSALGDFLVSPEGARIAYRSRGRWQVYDTATRALVPSAGNFTTPGDWSRDGDYLLTDVDGQPFVSQLAPSKSWPLLPSRLPANWMLDAAGDAAWWAPDRTYVILTFGAGTPQKESRQWHGVTAEAVAKAAGVGK